jgi:hypothetical protein
MDCGISKDEACRLDEYGFNQFVGINDGVIF